VREDKKLNEMKKNFMGREAVGDWTIRVIWGARDSGGEKNSSSSHLAFCLPSHFFRVT